VEFLQQSLLKIFNEEKTGEKRFWNIAQ